MLRNYNAILLLEASFNTMHKVIFNNRLLSSIEVVKAILIEIIGRRRSQGVTYLVLVKKLISDIASVRKLPTITVCAIVTNYYKRVAHPFASLYMQYFGAEIIYLAILFRAIHLIKIFL